MAGRFPAGGGLPFSSLRRHHPQRNSPPQIPPIHASTSANPPFLKLSHPILRSLDASSAGGKSFPQILAQIIALGIFHDSLAAGRAVGKLCSSDSPSSIADAVVIFSYLEEPDALICNHILRAYVRFGDPRGGLVFYRRHMVRRSVPPNHFTFPLLVKLCADFGVVGQGIGAHGLTVKLGFEGDVFVRNSLIYMYSCFGRIDSAQRIFYSCGEGKNIVTWNSIIDGFVKNGRIGEARKVFDEMPERDGFSWNVMISGYASIGDMDMTRELFDEMPGKDIVSWNSMLVGYSKSGGVAVARELFNKMPERNLISWNTILAAYVRSKDYRECLTLFEEMLASGFNPTEATLVSVLTSCAHLGDLNRGMWVHSYIENSGKRIDPDLLLLTSLLTMYTKCGDMDSARKLFDEMPLKGVIAWNAMITGYGRLGRGEESMNLFLEMEREGKTPNATTFVCLLSACAHRGLILEGWWCFDRMIRKYKIEPKVDHYGCMVDLLGRAGLLDDTKELMEKMPGKPGVSTLGALLSACSTYSDLKLAEAVGSRIIEMDPDDVGSYVLLSNIYASKGRWDDVERVRREVRSRGLLKGAGVSSLSNEKSEDLFMEERDMSMHDRGIMLSMLSEMDAHMKVSS